MPGKLEDVEVERVSQCRDWLTENGMAASSWVIEWVDGGTMYITAMRDGKSLREFKSMPECTYERDPYIGDPPRWEPIPR